MSVDGSNHPISENRTTITSTILDESNTNFSDSRNSSPPDSSDDDIFELPVEVELRSAIKNLTDNGTNLRKFKSCAVGGILN